MPDILSFYYQLSMYRGNSDIILSSVLLAPPSLWIFEFFLFTIILQANKMLPTPPYDPPPISLSVKEYINVDRDWDQKWDCPTFNYGPVARYRYRNKHWFNYTPHFALEKICFQALTLYRTDCCCTTWYSP